MNKRYGLLHIPDATTDEATLPAWYPAEEVAELVNELRSARKERDQYSRQLFTIGEVLGDWAMNKHAPGKVSATK